MQTYDLLMLFVLVATTLFGYWKGMAWQIASLASLFVSYLAALRFSAQLAPTFGDSAPLNRFVAMLVIYIVTSFVIWTLFRLVSSALDKVKLESFDAQMGAMFGAAKGVALCVVLTVFAVTLLPPAQGEAIVNSKSGRYIVALLDKSNSIVPPEIHQIIDPYVNKVEQLRNPNYQPNGDALRGLWQSQAQSSGQQSNWPQLPQLPQINWPQAPAQPAQSQQPQTAWPTSWPPVQQQSAPQPQSYNAPREPNPFPAGPYSAQGASGRDY